VSERRQRLNEARLYLVCDQRAGAFLDEVLSAGVDIVQLRMKDAPDEQVLSEGRRFAEVCAAHDALFILNDRPDLAAELGADGVHVGQDDVSVQDARQTVGADRLVGLSTHTAKQIDTAEGADYIGVGPVHATPTKPGRPATGLDYVRHAAQTAQLPWFAIGGIDATNVGELIRAGARRIVVVRAIANAADPENAARELSEALMREPVGTP
jgi:thiamine-phosphate pyrophosphorylase